MPLFYVSCVSVILLNKIKLQNIKLHHNRHPYSLVLCSRSLQRCHWVCELVGFGGRTLHCISHLWVEYGNVIFLWSHPENSYWWTYLRVKSPRHAQTWPTKLPSNIKENVDVTKKGDSVCEADWRHFLPHLVPQACLRVPCNYNFSSILWHFQLWS